MTIDLSPVMAAQPSAGSEMGSTGIKAEPVDFGSSRSIFQSMAQTVRPKTSSKVSESAQSNSVVLGTEVVSDTASVQDSIDVSSIRGLFGWATIDGVSVPYLLREGNQYVAVRIVEQKLLARFPNTFPDELGEHESLVSYYITQNEIRLLDEINSVHCNYDYGRQLFTAKDLIVKLAEFEDFYNLVKKTFPQEVLESRRVGIPLPPPSEVASQKSGWLQINNTVTPYLRRGIKKYVVLQIIKHAAKLLTDVDVESTCPEEEEYKQINEMCLQAGLDFRFGKSAKLVSLNEVVKHHKAVLLELPRVNPMSHAQYNLSRNEVSSSSQSHTTSAPTVMSSGSSVLVTTPTSSQIGNSVGPFPHRFPLSALTRPAISPSTSILTSSIHGSAQRLPPPGYAIPTQRNNIQVPQRFVPPNQYPFPTTINQTRNFFMNQSRMSIPTNTQNHSFVQNSQVPIRPSQVPIRPSLSSHPPLPQGKRSNQIRKPADWSQNGAMRNMAPPVRGPMPYQAHQLPSVQVSQQQVSSVPQNIRTQMMPNFMGPVHERLQLNQAKVHQKSQINQAAQLNIQAQLSQRAQLNQLVQMNQQASMNVRIHPSNSTNANMQNPQAHLISTNHLMQNQLPTQASHVIFPIVDPNYINNNTVQIMNNGFQGPIPRVPTCLPGQTHGMPSTSMSSEKIDPNVPTQPQNIPLNPVSLVQQTPVVPVQSPSSVILSSPLTSSITTAGKNSVVSQQMSSTQNSLSNTLPEKENVNSSLISIGEKVNNTSRILPKPISPEVAKSVSSNPVLSQSDAKPDPPPNVTAAIAPEALEVMKLAKCVTGVKFENRSISCLEYDNLKGKHALVEAVAKLYFPQWNLNEFMYVLEQVLKIPTRACEPNEEKAFIHYYRLPVPVLKCNKMVKLHDLSEHYSKLTYMFAKMKLGENSNSKTSNEPNNVNRFDEDSPVIILDDSSKDVVTTISSEPSSTAITGAVGVKRKHISGPATQPSKQLKRLEDTVERLKQKPDSLSTTDSSLERNNMSANVIVLE